MILLFLFGLLIPRTLAAKDILRDHLENLVNYSINPCDDFYSHVCKQDVTIYPRTTRDKMLDFYKLVFWYADVDKTNVILRDINTMLGVNSDSVKNMNYRDIVRQRCGLDLNCYRAEREYFEQKLAQFNNREADQAEVEENVDDLPAEIENTIAVSAKNIEEISNILFTLRQNRTIYIHNNYLNQIPNYEKILKRIEVIKFLRVNRGYNFYNITKFANLMKGTMLEKINSTSWLHQDEISEAILGVLLKRVYSIGVYQDFDHLDQSMSILQGMERKLEQLYRNIEERSTGVEEVDICLRLVDAFHSLRANFTIEEQLYYERIPPEFERNAYYYPLQNYIILHAPLLFKNSVSSKLIIEPLLTYGIVAHELFHSMFIQTSSFLIDVYGKRGQCLKDHYNQTCSQFGKGICASKDYTIYEDGADAEGLRLLYEMFARDHSTELEDDIGFHGTTMHQAYFYYTSLYFCKTSHDDPHSIEDVHSPSSVRVNGVVSLMPEFSEAFKCKPGDRMFTEKPKCKIFGKDA